MSSSILAPSTSKYGNWASQVNLSGFSSNPSLVTPLGPSPAPAPARATAPDPAPASTIKPPMDPAAAAALVHSLIGRNHTPAQPVLPPGPPAIAAADPPPPPPKRIEIYYGSLPPPANASIHHHRLWAYTSRNRLHPGTIFPWPSLSPVIPPPPAPLFFSPMLTPPPGLRVRMTIDLILPANEVGRAQLEELRGVIAAGKTVALKHH